MSDPRHDVTQPCEPPAGGPTLTPGPSGPEAVTGPPAGPPGPGPATAIPGYEVEGELGRGGMGVVYRARQHGLNRPVALKMVLAGTHAPADDLVRFLAEAETAARLQHQGIAQIFDSG